ncbi:MAG TPA: indole-3-glycerol phosphate synthase TrpC [bacterium]|nr:indole-3-glycerol phosphate synthase TrpC [bacterium]HOL34481.1 indole-3-glycerol phosphate synthase TrpC [bacterium]HPP08461.1 indole-3-glycerol phosphate synthase TrpC [bacterium]
MLKKILEHKKNLVGQKKLFMPLDVLKQKVHPVLCRSIIEKTKQRPFIIIAETKKASPSGGIFRKRYSPSKIAASYEKGGASAISVLTEERFFLGHVRHLQYVKDAVNVPVVAKDFFIDPYQIYEAKMYGADCILLILRILSDEQFISLLNLARHLNLEVLIELHTEKEIQRFFDLTSINNGVMIGINSRDLDSLRIDLNDMIYLLSLLKGVKIPVIAESGINDAKTLVNLFNAGANGALIGSYFLKAKSPGMALKNLLKEMCYG